MYGTGGEGAFPLSCTGQVQKLNIDQYLYIENERKWLRDLSLETLKAPRTRPAEQQTTNS